MSIRSNGTRPNGGRPERTRPGKAAESAAGRLVELVVDRPVHGGWCLGRVDGRAVFVRHTAPGERVRARIVEGRDGDRFWRADAVEILEPSPDRVPTVWPEAGPGGVGGGELAHLTPSAQRRWKSAVIADAFARIGSMRAVAEVASLGEDGYRDGYRTRVHLIADDDGHAGMRRARSHEVLPLADMPLAVPEIRALELFGRRWPAGARIDVVAPTMASPIVAIDGEDSAAPMTVRERVAAAGRTVEYQVPTWGFWQVHRRAPQVLVEAVLAAAEPALTRPAPVVWDLYAGAGLFTGFLAEAHEGVRVVSVEADRAAHDAARLTFGTADQIELVRDTVQRWLRSGGARQRPDVVVLDPPRAGAGRDVIAALAAIGTEHLIYVACDPAALARDCATARTFGFELVQLQGFDLFPHTHHVECLAVLAQVSP